VASSNVIGIETRCNVYLECFDDAINVQLVEGYVPLFFCCHGDARLRCFHRVRHSRRMAALIRFWCGVDCGLRSISGCWGGICPACQILLTSFFRV
jgi:hypothetical protein